MSDGPRITLERAEAFVLAIFQRRLGYASIEEAAREGVEVVGSIRRRRPDIGDIEIIAPLPRAADPEKVQSSEDRLFRELNLCVSNPWVDSSGSLFAAAPDTSRAFGTAVRGLKPGFKACSLRLAAYGVEVGLDVFRYDALNAGWVKLCRTGPSEFGQWFLGRWKERQGIPVGDPARKASVDGYLVDARGSVVPVASEEEAFRLIGANVVPPERRDAMVEAMASRRGSA
jgi:hypothetical protein